MVAVRSECDHRSMTQRGPETTPLEATTREPEVGPEPRRRVWNIVLTMLTVVVLLGAAIAVVLGVQARSSADDTRAHAVVLRHDRHAWQTRQREAEHTMDTINSAVAKVPTTFDTLAKSLATVVSAQRSEEHT